MYWVSNGHFLRERVTQRCAEGNILNIRRKQYPIFSINLHWKLFFNWVKILIYILIGAGIEEDVECEIRLLKSYCVANRAFYGLRIRISHFRLHKEPSLAMLSTSCQSSEWIFPMFIIIQIQYRYTLNIFRADNISITFQTTSSIILVSHHIGIPS